MFQEFTVKNTCFFKKKNCKVFIFIIGYTISININNTSSKK